MIINASNDEPKKIGIMGGTFNPVHHGHLVTAQEALDQFGLDEVIFIPTGDPPHKIEDLLAHAEDRYLMTVIATSSNSSFFVYRVEIDRKGKSYTIDTVKELRELLKTKLNELNTSIDGIYFCPHRPDENCICRKPNPELILKAAREYDIDLENSWMIGDSQKDILAGKNAKCNTILLKKNQKLTDIIKELVS